MPFEFDNTILSSFILKEGPHWYILLNVQAPKVEHAELLSQLDEIRNATGIPPHQHIEQLQIDWHVGHKLQYARLPEVVTISQQLFKETKRQYTFMFSTAPASSFATQQGITLDCSILNQPTAFIAHVLSHEWAHCYLGHCYSFRRTPSGRRNQEREADRFSAKFMAKYHYPIKPAYRFYLKQPNSGFPTHPSGRERARSILLAYNQERKALAALSRLSRQKDKRLLSLELHESKKSAKLTTPLLGSPSTSG